MWISHLHKALSSVLAIHSYSLLARHPLPYCVKCSTKRNRDSRTCTYISTLTFLELFSGLSSNNKHFGVHGSWGKPWTQDASFTIPCRDVSPRATKDITNILLARFKLGGHLTCPLAR
ncbi:uncharacterized protein F4817DRAFT_258456 [Daldinia loculata]|uniref:uncharacterized protein n=1 Tax=Daldinia loculata TaxID=103429 RepID=UPI0020C52ABF|nr:uncharacterized protein F4817DRAFT_258456 [Daldinia loculata]KAI1643327.1 hypothetical protein F4817DRAFT_258456 [Daldinia loculata]